MKEKKTSQSFGMLFSWQRLWCTCLLLAGSILSAQPTVMAQARQSGNVSLHVRDVSLTAALQQLNRDYGNQIMFKKEEVDKETKRITIDVTDVTLLKAVETCLEGTHLQAMVRVDIVVVGPRKEEVKQDIVPIRVSGKVTDEKGQPLPGVTIKIKGTTVGTATNVDGHYSITLPGNRKNIVLVYSFVGMEVREIAYAEQPELNVSLKSMIEEMDEVVVTGYQTISKERATGAYSIVNAQTLETKPTANISSALNGLVPGLAVQSSPVEGTTRFVIRGQGTLQEDQSEMDPLIVVDGFPISDYSGGNDPFESINPNDVENITVLKDAAATSIYGARAANGVIVITTKKEKTGKKLDISADAYWSVSSRVDLDYAFNMASPENHFRYIELCNKYAPIAISGTSDPYITPTVQVQFMSAPYSMLFERDIKGHMSVAEYETEKARLIEMGNRSVWKDDLNEYVFRHALRSQYNVALRGASDRTNYAFSASYNDEKGYAQGNEKKRVILNMMTNAKLTKNLTFDINLNTTFGKDKNNGISLSSLKEYISPWTRLVDDNENFIHVPTSSTVYQPILDSPEWYAGKMPVDWHYNPVSDRQYVDNESKTMNYRVHGGFNYATTWGLNVSAKGQYEWRRNFNRNEYDSESFYVRNLYNTYSRLNSATGRMESIFPQGGIYTEKGNIYEAYNLRAQADYNLKKNKHALAVLAGTEILSSTMEKTPDITRYGYNKYTNSVLTASDYISSMTNIFGKTQTSPYTPLGTLSKLEDRFFSVYANAAYTLDDKYSLTISFRTDASNFQSKNQRDKFSPFWSAGAAWLLSKESFMSNATIVNLLKLRASVGIAGVAAGKSNTSSVTTVSTYPGLPNYTNNESYNTIFARGNSTLTWEKSRTVNVGLDASLWNHKLSGSIEFYNKYSYDVLSDATVASIPQGVESAKFNNAEVLNRGVELSLSSNLTVAGDLKWRGTLNYAFNHNEVKKFNVTTSYSAGFQHGYVEGYPTDFWLVSKPVGYTPEGLIQLQGKDGSLETITNRATGHSFDQIYRNLGETLTDNNWFYYLGSKTPKSNLSFTNQFTWKGITLSFMITGRFGYYVCRGDHFSSSWNSASYTKQLDKSFAVYDEGYANQKSYSAYPLYNDENITVYKAYTVANDLPCFQSYYIKGDHIRLNEIYLGYDLPERLLDRQSVFKRINIYAQASNLGLIWSKNGEMDPDYTIGNLKPMPIFTFGLKVSFKNW